MPVISLPLPPSMSIPVSVLSYIAQLGHILLRHRHPMNDPPFYGYKRYQRPALPPTRKKIYTVSIPRICQKNRRKSNVIITFPQMPLFTCRYISKLVCMYHKHILYISIYIYITIKHVYIYTTGYIYIYYVIYIS